MMLVFTYYRPLAVKQACIQREKERFGVCFSQDMADMSGRQTFRTGYRQPTKEEQKGNNSECKSGRRRKGSDSSGNSATISRPN